MEVRSTARTGEQHIELTTSISIRLLGSTGL
jgi:hypothetical protein